jgi:LacI family transcriptional regulator
MAADRNSSKKRATIYDVARHAQVSPGTASRVLNNRDRVDPETRARVLSSAKTLNLKPRAGARMQQIAVLSEPNFPDRVEGYAARLTSHLSFCLSRRNASVLHPSDPVSQLPGTFLDGVIAVTYERELATLLSDLEKRTPVIYMDKFDGRADQHIVRSDHYMAGYVAAQHFIARGKKRLAMVGMDCLPMNERVRGYRKAIEEAGLKVEEKLLQLVSRHAASTNYASNVTQKVRAGADALFAPGSSYEGISCLHVLSYIMDLRVPHDIAIIAGEIPGISENLNPPLTAVEEPLADMAEQAVEMMMQLAAGEKPPRRHVTLPVRLIERASVV